MSEELTEYSIAWLLMAIYFAEGATDEHVPKPYHDMNFPEDLMKKFKNILPIIYMGDYINVAIFTDEELKKGIQYLLDKGFITEEEGFLKTTEKFEPVYEKTAEKMNYRKKKISLDVIRQIIKDNL